MVEAEVGQCDSVVLSPLSEEAFVHNLCVRYKRDLIYTYIGNVLLSLNPHRQLSLYSAELVRTYLTRAPFQLPPHVYAVAATAFRWLRDRNQCQCIIITGESGAGKTEVARISLQCVVLAGGGGSHVTHAQQSSEGCTTIRERLTMANTLLEAFGNAKTLRNNNASRFGKYLDIEFDYKGDTIGGHITHYLLEKSRVTCLHQGDRNFHIFYQLLVGADVHLLKCLKLQRSVEAYRILRRPRPSGAPPPPPPKQCTEDKSHFAFTKTALETLGFTCNEVVDIFKLVAVVLKLCNIEFIPSTNIDGTVGCTAHQEYEIVECASLLGCNTNALMTALQGEWCAEEAATRRDQLARTLYTRLFTWLLHKVNTAIKVKEYSKRSTLSILDMYGFECLEENSLEQLVINYSNEVLHNVVLHTSLHALQEDYIQEGLDWQRIPYFDNEPICRLIDEERHGLLSLLEEPHVAEGGASQLLTRLHHCWAGHSHLVLQPPTHFQLRHYAGTVTYDTNHFVEKNTDQLNRALALLLYQCSHSLTKELFPEGNPERVCSRKPSPVGSSQRVALGALTTALKVRTLHHVHCLRPNDQQRPRIFHTPLVQHQVRYSGLMETVLLWRSGHCASVLFSSLVQRFAPLLPRGSASLPPLHACRALLRSLPIPPAEFAFGRTKLFIRSPRAVFELEEMRNMRLEELAVVIQRVWRGYTVRRDMERKAEAQRIIATGWRRWKSRHTREERRVVLRRRRTRKRILSMKLEKRVVWAVITIQNYYIQMKKRSYLLGLMASVSPGHMSPLCTSWPRAPPLLHHTHALLRRIHHTWRCHMYRMKFDQTARNRMREKVTASIIFKDRKQNYSRSVSHPFVGDYVRLRQNTVWKRVCIDTDDQYVVFADIVNKVTRSTGKMVPTLAVISTSAMLVLDQRTLSVKYRIPATEIYRISVSPLSDHICIFHVRAREGCTEAECYEMDSLISSRGSSDTTGCLFGSDLSKKKGDFVFETCHMIEMVTKLFLVVQNAMGKAPDVNISTEFEANFGQQTVTFSFKCFPALMCGDGGGARVVRKGNKMEVLV